MNNDLIHVNTLPPFKRMCMTIGELPTSYLESMTYYEMLVWLCNYLEKTVIPTINNNGEAVEELQGLYIQLKSFVDNYFDNLDVQEEINNKLDDMAESGELTDIIAQYLGLAGMIAFDTVADMKLADNLVNGSKCTTLGYRSVNDEGASTYKIRTITNEDTVDEMFIIALSNINLVAELIINDSINPKQLGAKGNGTDDDSSYIQAAINKAGSGDYKVILNGTYAINSTIVFNNLIRANFESNGVINLLSDTVAFRLSNSSGCNINIRNITAENIGTAIEIIADSRIIASNNITINSILYTKNGIVLHANNNFGLQYNKIYFNSLYTTDNGIILQCGDDSTPWINENQFYGGRISSGIGIKTVKGTNQTDKFNGNKFYHCALEGITNIGINLEFTQYNIFEDFRFAEGFTGTYLFSFTNCKEDIIKWDGIRPGLPVNKFQFTGTNEFIHFIGALRYGGVTVSSESIYHRNGWFDITPLYQGRLNFYNRTDNVIERCRNGMLVVVGCDDNHPTTITVPDIMSNDGTLNGETSPYLNYFFLGTLYKGDTINFIDSDNNTIIDNSLLDGHKLYLVIRYTISSGNKYYLITLDSNYRPSD